mgnify:CR=1 FL=1
MAKWLLSQKNLLNQRKSRSQSRKLFPKQQLPKARKFNNLLKRAKKMKLLKHPKERQLALKSRLLRVPKLCQSQVPKLLQRPPKSLLLAIHNQNKSLKRSKNQLKSPPKSLTKNLSKRKPRRCHLQNKKSLKNQLSLPEKQAKTPKRRL